MSEQLVVRLGSDSSQEVHWLVWSATEQEIIASGILADAKGLSELKDRAGGRPIIALLPSCDISFKRVELPSRSNKQLLTALPYMLEEELSADVDNLHFSVLEKQGNQVTVAIVAHDKMRLWQSWLRDANLSYYQFIPDVLTLPLQPNGWSAVQLGLQWLVRQGKTQGICVENDLLALALGSPADSTTTGEEPASENETEQGANDSVISYSAIDQLALDSDSLAKWQQGPLELPMKLCAEGAINTGYNLLQGQYKIKRETSQPYKIWMATAIAAGLAVVVFFANQYVDLYRLEQRQAELDGQIKNVYKTVFRQEKVRLNTRLIKKQMQRKLADLQQGGGEGGFLMMLSQLKPALRQSKDFEPITIRFDGKQKTLRLQASAKGFEEFDKFKAQLINEFDVEQGTISQRQNKVHGTLTIRSKG